MTIMARMIIHNPAPGQNKVIYNFHFAVLPREGERVTFNEPTTGLQS
jgi:hypothetical protein